LRKRWGKGDARIAEVIEALDRHGYERWFVLEQDTAITGEEPTVGSGPMLNVKESIAFLLNSAPTTQEVS
jgi:inosose dehydratase